MLRPSASWGAVAVCLCSLVAAISPSTLVAQPIETVDITMDLAHLVRLNSAVSTIVIGNPDIADATVQDKRTLVLTGRGLGVINMMVFDETGQQISNLLLRVVPQQARVIVRYDSTGSNRFLCVPACSQLPPIAVAEK